MYDILIIQPSTFFSGRLDMEAMVPTHLLLLSGPLLQEGYSVKILQLSSREFPDIPQSLKDLNPYFNSLIKSLQNYDGVKYVGISCFASTYYLASVITAWAVRKAIPEATIFVGGYGPTTNPGDFIYENSPFDYVMTGEADTEYTRLINRLKNASEKERFPGKYGKPVLIQCEAINDIDALPIIDWTALDDTPFKNSTVLHIPFYTSRGCPFSCKFCCDFSNMEKLEYKTRWRSRSIDNIFRELEGLNSYLGNKPAFIYFNDAIFGLRRSWKKEMISSLIDRTSGMKNRFYWLEERVDSITEEDIVQYAKLNLMINFGFESGSPRILQLINKTKNPKTYLEKMKWNRDMLERHDIYYSFHIMFGFPGETAGEMEESQRFGEQLLEKSRYALPYIEKYNFFPGSYVYYNYDKPEYSGFNVYVPDWYKRICNYSYILPLADPSPSHKFIDVYKSIALWSQSIYNLVQQNFTPIQNKLKSYHFLKKLFLDQMSHVWDYRPGFFAALANGIKEHMPMLLPVDNRFHDFVEQSPVLTDTYADFIKSAMRAEGEKINV